MQKIQSELSFVASAPEGPPRKLTFNHEEKTKHGSQKQNFKEIEAFKFTNKFPVPKNDLKIGGKVKQIAKLKTNPSTI